MKKFVVLGNKKYIIVKVYLIRNLRIINVNLMDINL